MLEIRRTIASNPAFVALTKELDRELAEADGEDHAFYTQFNKIDHKICGSYI